MSILLIAQSRDLSFLNTAIKKIDSDPDVEIWPDVRHPERVMFAVAWNQPGHVFEKYPNLKAVSSLGAGADHLIFDETIPKHIRITRLVLPSLKEQMSDYILMGALNLCQNSSAYIRQQQKGTWNVLPQTDKRQIRAGIMGLGELGKYSALRLHQNGFRVSGWSRSNKEIKGIKTYKEQKLPSFLSETNILINLLPLTKETEGILNLEVFKQLKKPAYLINAARGEHLVAEDLLYALDTNLISHAILDVFSEEPLPESHPFWNREKITITPHVAASTDETEAAELIIENYKRLLSGMELLHEVDRKKNEARLAGGRC